MRTPDLSPEAQRELDAVEAALANRPVPGDLADWADLVAELRDERPQIDPGFATRLDGRDWAAGTGKPKRGRRARFALVPAFAASLLLAVAVSTSLLSGGGSDGPDRFTGGGSDEAAVSEDSGAGSGAGSVAAPEVAGDPAERLVERGASLLLAVAPEKLDPVAARVQSIAEAAGGYVQSSSMSSSGEGGGGNFDLRIPVERLDRTVGELARLGKVRERSQSSQDITAVAVSARDQLEDAQAERRSLLVDLREATGDRERLRLRARLRAVSREIASARAALRNAENRAAFALVSVALTGDPELGDGQSGAGSGWTPGDAWRDAGRILEVAAGVLLIAFAVGLPLGLVAAAGWLAFRLLTRRRRALG